MFWFDLGVFVFGLGVFGFFFLVFEVGVWFLDVGIFLILNKLHAWRGGDACTCSVFIYVCINTCVRMCTHVYALPVLHLALRYFVRLLF